MKAFIRSILCQGVRKDTEHSNKQSKPSPDSPLPLPGWQKSLVQADLEDIAPPFRSLINKTQVSQCVRWAVLCWLECDLLARGAPSPDRLACRFCKRSHPLQDFGIPGKNVGYGVERLYLLQGWAPQGRFCWRHIPKRLNYTTTQVATEEKWVVVRHLTCLHYCS